MAHNLEQINGVTSFVCNTKNGLPWHGLGQQVEQNMTVAEALSLSHADYEVQTREIFALTPQIEEALRSGSVPADVLLESIIRGKKATVRLDNNHAMGVVSDRYQVVQNADAFRFVDTLCSGSLLEIDSQPVIDTAGVLGNGERVFVCAKFADTIKLSNKEDDVLEMYCVFTTSHDGTGAVTAMITPTRVVCNNTLNLAFRSAKNKLYFKHTSGVMDRMDLTQTENLKDASRVLGLYSVYKAELEARVNWLQNKTMDKFKINDIVAEVLFPEDDYEQYKLTHNVFNENISTRTQTNYTKFMDVLESGVGQNQFECDDRGSAMWLLNGFTTYFNNYKPYFRRNADEKIRKFDGILTGTESQQLQKAYNLLAV